jgi:long-chain acyl-CoA synthetase
VHTSRHFGHLGYHAALTPHKLALVRAASGAGSTYAELDARSNQLAWLLHAHGLRRGDQVAALLGDDLRVVDVAWAVLRSGLCLRAQPAGLEGCDARVLVAAYALREQAARLADRLPYCELRLMAGGCAPGWDAYEDAVATQPTAPLAEQWLGALERPVWSSRPLDEGPDGPRAEALQRQGIDARAVALAAAPSVHPEALAQLVDLQFCGATAVVLEPRPAGGAAALAAAEAADAADAVDAAIARYGVTHVLVGADGLPLGRPDSAPTAHTTFPITSRLIAQELP